MWDEGCDAGMCPQGFDAEALEPFLDSKTVPLVVEMSKDPANRDLLSKVFQSPKSKVSRATTWCAYTEVETPILEDLFPYPTGTMGISVLRIWTFSVVHTHQF